MYKMPNKVNLENLIKAVKKHPKLYSNLARDTDDDWKEWSAVAQECKMSIIGAQNQWSILLMEYVEYLKNNEDFSLAQHMEFLQPYFFTMLDGENIDEEELSKAVDSKTLEESVICLEDTKNEFKDLNTSIEEKNIKMEDTDKTEISPTMEKTGSKEVCKSSATSQDSSFTNFSPLELIFLGYAKQLQKMPLALQLKTKRQIAVIMDDAELQAIS